MSTVVGQDLENLFRAWERGQIGKAEFSERKAALLTWSKCHFSLITPRALRFRAPLASGADGRPCRPVVTS